MQTETNTTDSTGASAWKKGWRNLLLNLVVLGAASASITLMAVLLEWGSGVYLTRAAIAPEGFIFFPHVEEHYDTSDYACSVYTNSLGFRDREVGPNREHRYRVVAIGDSFTFGWGVDLEDTWIKILERRLRAEGFDIEILNLGKPAAGPIEYARLARASLPYLKPDLVILGILMADDLNQSCAPFNPKDWFQDEFANTSRLFKHWLYANPFLGPPPVQTAEQSRRVNVFTAKGLLEKNFDAPVRARFEKLDDGIKNFFYDGLINPWMIYHATGSPDYFNKSFDPKDETVRTMIGCMGKALTRVRKAAERVQARTMAVSIPEGCYTNKPAQAHVRRIGFWVDPKMLGNTDADRCTLLACEQAGIPCVSAFKAFLAEQDNPKLYLEFDRHMNKEGHKLLAESMLPEVRKEVLELAAHARQD